MEVEFDSGSEQTLTSFPPTPSPLTNGPPVIENVPTSIHWVGSQLLVTILGGAPFLPGYSKVLQVDPQTGAVVSLVEGLTAAIDSTPLAANTLSAGLLTLEHNLAYPQPGMGRLQSFIVSAGNAVTHSTCLVTPSSMLIDRTSGRVILTELSTGRLVWLPVPSNLTKGGYIYWSNYSGGDIRRANLDGTGQKVLVSGFSTPIGPALDLSRGRMYWSETSSGTMRRSNLDGTGQTIVVSSPNGGLPALDLAAGRMYWSVAERGDIRSANLDGSGQQVLVAGLNDPHAGVLDLVGGKIYWPEAGGGKIWRANLDGTGATILVPGLVRPSLMALDIPNGKMYWTGGGAGGDIRRANLDGSGQEILVRNLNGPAGIALDVDNGHLYWANSFGGDIRRANLDGTGQKTLISGLSGPAFLTLDLSPLRTPDIQTVTKSDGTFTFSWSALMGRGYQVQFKAGLTQSNWTNLGSRVTATNATITALDSVGTSAQRFYRVLLLP